MNVSWITYHLYNALFLSQGPLTYVYLSSLQTA
jgi:hypothetical protein